METLGEFRAFLAEQLMKVAKGQLSPAHANASANLAGKVLGSIKLELDYCKASGHNPSINFIEDSLPVASNLLEHKDDEIDEATGEVKIKK